MRGKKWQDFEAEAPDLGKLGKEALDRFGVLLLGTLRKNGYPRICPVEPLFAGGELYPGMIWQSKKALDLLRDPRCTLHSAVSDRNGTEGEFKVYGRARDVQDAKKRELYAAELEKKIDWRPQGSFHCFTIDVESAAYRKFSESVVTSMVWYPGREVVKKEEAAEV